jgi:putative DNA primase/helicase
MSSHRSIERVLDALEGVEQQHDGCFKALCPAHDDHNPSLAIKGAEENGTILVHCPVCKDQEKVLRALEERGIARSDLFDRNGRGPDRYGGKRANRLMCVTHVYNYRTPDGKFIKHLTLRGKLPPEGKEHHPDCQGEHFYSSKEDKDFRQARPDPNGGFVYGLDGTQTVLYNLPDVMRAALDGEMVVLVEGEKDADNGKERLELTTTTCPMGAKKWKPHYAGFLMGAHVVVVPDNDTPGREHAQMVAREVLHFAASVKILELPDLPEGGDLSDWIEAGGNRAKFDSLVEKAPEFDSGHLGGEYGRNESLPVRRVSEILAESGKGADWKVKSLLASGNITDLSGEAKFSGKTTWAMHMIARILDGKDFMGFPTVISKVLYLTEQGNNFAEALQKAGLQDADGKLFAVQHRDVRAIPWGELVSSAVEECKRIGADVLVVDTFAAFSGIVGDEENKSGAIRDKMAPLKEAAQEHHLAVLYIRHAGKSGTARGSSQFEAEGDIILSLKRAEGNQKENVRVLEGIGRYDEIPRKLNIELTEDGYVALGSDGQVQFGKAVETIRGVLPRDRDHAMTQDELIEELEVEEVSRKTMQRALKWLVEEGSVREEGKGVKGNPYRYWIPDGPPSPTPPDDEIHSGQTPIPNGRNRIRNSAAPMYNRNRKH